MQQKLGSGADAGKNAVSNEEMEKLKAALKAKDEALGGMKKQMVSGPCYFCLSTNTFVLCKVDMD